MSDPHEMPELPTNVRCCYCGGLVDLSSALEPMSGETRCDVKARVELMVEMMEDGIRDALECGRCRR